MDQKLQALLKVCRQVNQQRDRVRLTIINLSSFDLGEWKVSEWNSDNKLFADIYDHTYANSKCCTETFLALPMIRKNALATV